MKPRHNPLLMPAPRRGLTLIELIVSLVLAGLLLGTLWSAWSMLGERSADPLVARQSLAVAQSLLREIELQPLPGSAVAASAPGRLGLASIADYNGLVLNGISDAEGQALPGLESYRASVSVQPAALAGVPAAGGGGASPGGWWVEVHVAGPDQTGTPGSGTRLALWRAQR